MAQKYHAFFILSRGNFEVGAKSAAMWLRSGFANVNVGARVQKRPVRLHGSAFAGQEDMGLQHHNFPLFAFGKDKIIGNGALLRVVDFDGKAQHGRAFGKSQQYRGYQQSAP